MLALRTFGGLTLRLDGQNITGAATQRRRLALLALLAAAGEEGMPRETLVALLWPEASRERARHVLAQLLYAQRLELEAEELFLGSKSLRLNGSVITSDVAEFERALGAGELERAVEVYRGPFLEGFHVGENSEFERWQGERRRDYAARFGRALEGLAEAAGRRGEHNRAAGWWRRLAGHDPLNSRVAAGLIQALAASGDRAGALRHAAEHELALRQEVGVAPDRWFVELVARSRLE